MKIFITYSTIALSCLCLTIGCTQSNQNSRNMHFASDTLAIQPKNEILSNSLEQYAECLLERDSFMHLALKNKIEEIQNHKKLLGKYEGEVFLKICECDSLHTNLLNITK